MTDFRSLRAPLQTTPFDPWAWARAQGFVGQACPVITDIPGTVCRPDVRTADEPPRWPSFEAQAGAQRYLARPANRTMWNMSGLGSVNGLSGMGSAIDDVIHTVEREVSTTAEAAVERAALKWILPPMAASIALSLLALGVAISAYKRNARAGRTGNRRRRRRNRR